MMMEKKTFLQILNEASDAVLEYRLQDALFLLEALLKEIDFKSGSLEFQSIQCDYEAMLHFLVQGGEDADKLEQQDKLLKRTFQLIMFIKTVWKMQTEDDYLHDFGQADNAFGLGLRTDLPLGIEDDFNCLQIFPGTKQWPQYIGGLLLNCWELFSPTVIHFLANIAEHDAYALTGLVILTYRYGNVIRQLWPELDKKIQEVFSKECVHAPVFQIQRELFSCSLSEQMNENISKNLMPCIMDGLRDEKIRRDFESEDSNDELKLLIQPEFFPSKEKKNEKKKRKFVESASILYEMVREGVDINANQFAPSSRLAFFLDMANWFKPFDVHDEAIENLAYINGKPNPMIQLLTEIADICDIDKYAMTLRLKKASLHAAMNEMLGGIMHEMKDVGLALKKDFEDKEQSPERAIRNIVRVLYRLFTMSKWKSQFVNLFTLNLNPLENGYVSPVFVNDPQKIEALVDMLMTCREYKMGYALLRKLDELQGSNARQLCMQAICLSCMHKYNQAALLLEQANMLTPDSLGIQKLLLMVYENSGEHEKQLEVLLRLENLLPENSNITSETGLCLMRLNRYQEASQRFYKLELEEKRVVPSLRAIAWCAFQQKKYDTAMRYYTKLFRIPLATRWEDYLNGGHVAWITGDMPRALSLYHQYVKHYLTDDPKIKDALEPFDNDYALLAAAGKTQREIKLMREMLQYNEKHQQV